MVLIGLVSLALCSRAAPVIAQGAAPAALSLEGQGGLATPGSQTTYALRLLNWTNRPVPGGVISYTLPAGVTYVPGSTRATTGGDALSTADPAAVGSTLTWGPFRVPAAGHTTHTPRGIHTVVQDLCLPEFIDLQLDQALALVGSGGYVTQLFYRITEQTTAPDACAVYFVNAAYDRNLVPILRLQGTLNPAGYWDKPAPGPRGDYEPAAAGFARYVAGLPRRDTQPLYVAVWNEPDLWIEWSNAPNAAEYAQFFVAVSRAIRGLTDPRIRILNGAVTPTNTGFIRRMLAVPGFVGAFDAWASHCYPYNHPAWYNIHSGTARYGNATIDCYLLERDAISRYGGRGDFKFVLTETGHGLGDDVYDFEGYPAINESNRATYMKDALSRYWPDWPEVIATTPFLLGDPANSWERFDWIDYDVHLNPPRFAFTPHAQYTVVAGLSKPTGATVPHGIQVTFEALVTPTIALGVHTGTLCGHAGDVTVPCSRTAAVRVVAQIEHAFLPYIGQGPDNGPDEGTWYLSAAGDAADGTDNGIAPTAFLTAAGGALADSAATESPAVLVPVEGEPQVAAWADGPTPERVYVGTAAGQLWVVDVRARRVVTHMPLGFAPRALAVARQPASVYVAADGNEIRLVDTLSGERLGYSADQVQRSLGLAFDPATNTLLVADAGAGAILRFSADLSQRLAVRDLDELPKQVLLDQTRRRLFVTLPGANQVAALDADTLQPLGRARLPGGPLLAAALDAVRGRLYVLSAASADYRTLAVLETSDLSRLALMAGTPAVPLQQASALAVSADGRLWVAEGNHLYRIAPDDYRLIDVLSLESPLRSAALAADPVDGGAVWVDARGVWLYNEIPGSIRIRGF